MLGVFVARGAVALNVVPEAWGGQFPAQVPVRLVGRLQEVEDASQCLEPITGTRPIHNYRVPEKNTYGPEVTEKVLRLFQVPSDLNQATQLSEPVGITPESALSEEAGLDAVKDFVHQRILAARGKSLSCGVASRATPREHRGQCSSPWDVPEAAMRPDGASEGA